MTDRFQRTDDLRIKEIKELLSPDQVRRELPLTEKAAETTYEARRAVHRILHGADDRLLVIVGPCSIHDPAAALFMHRAKQLALSPPGPEWEPINTLEGK